jgi:protein-disulfide isomerase-like protein with CxxC motif
MGIPGIGGGPYGGGRRGGCNESADDRQKMQDVVNPVQALTLAEAKKDVEVDMFDEQQRKSAFYTDGRKLQKTKDSTSQEIAAHWDGNRLVTDEKTPSGRKMSRTYELSYDGTQLYETLHLTQGRSSSTVSIRYVYDQVDAPKTNSPQTR